MRLPHHPIRRGVKVGHRDDAGDRSVFDVVRISDGKATLVRRSNTDGTAVDRNAEPEILIESLDTLVVVAEFGDPIYPGLKRLGSIDRGGDKPAHVVINGENHHALEALRFTHAGKVDCIYIDPPYNTGARDWKYNNDYVDDDDAYRHSKWLAFMERRLRLAKELLNPDDSVLIVTIDEKEVLRLGLLLEQTFPGHGLIGTPVGAYHSLNPPMKPPVETGNQVLAPHRKIEPLGVVGCPNCPGRTSRSRRSTSRHFPSTCVRPATTRQIARRPTTSSACRSRSGTRSGRRRTGATGRTSPVRSSRCSISRSRTRARSFRAVRRERGSPSSRVLQAIDVPPYYPDTPVVREELARMYDNIADMDGQVGEILKQLEDDGLAENTIVFYWSDHGDGVPRSKRSLYDSGLRVPLMIRWPKGLGSTLTPGSVNDDLVSFIDLAPTVLALAGAEIPAHLQGRVLVGPKAGPAPEFVFAARDRMDTEYDMMRSARDGRFLYIRNFSPELPYAGHITYRNQSAIMQEWFRLQAEGKLTGPAALWMRTSRPAEELYDTRGRSASDSQSCQPSRLTAPRSNACAGRSPSGWRVSAIRVW